MIDHRPNPNEAPRGEPQRPRFACRDPQYHYRDGSFRWVPPRPDIDSERWAAEVRQHRDHHNAQDGLPAMSTRTRTRGQSTLG